MSDKFISLTDPFSLPVRYFYRGHVFVSTYGMDENNTEPFTYDVIFNDKDLSISRQSGVDWFKQTIEGIERNGKYFLPYESPDKFVLGKHSCYSVVLSLIETNGIYESEYDLLGTDKETMMETMELEEQIL